LKSGQQVLNVYNLVLSTGVKCEKPIEKNQAKCEKNNWEKPRQMWKKPIEKNRVKCEKKQGKCEKPLEYIYVSVADNHFPGIEKNIANKNYFLNKIN